MEHEQPGPRADELRRQLEDARAEGTLISSDSKNNSGVDRITSRAGSNGSRIYNRNHIVAGVGYSADGLSKLAYGEHVQAQPATAVSRPAADRPLGNTLRRIFVQALVGILVVFLWSFLPAALNPSGDAPALTQSDAETLLAGAHHPQLKEILGPDITSVRETLTLLSDLTERTSLKSADSLQTQVKQVLRKYEDAFTLDQNLARRLTDFHITSRSHRENLAFRISSGSRSTPPTLSPLLYSLVRPVLPRSVDILLQASLLTPLERSFITRRQSVVRFLGFMERGLVDVEDAANKAATALSSLDTALRQVSVEDEREQIEQKYSYLQRSFWKWLLNLNTAEMGGYETLLEQVQEVDARVCEAAARVNDKLAWVNETLSTVRRVRAALDDEKGVWLGNGGGGLGIWWETDVDFW